MAYVKQFWRCGTRGCSDEAIASVMVIVATPGNRRERVKKATRAVRLCPADLRTFVAGIEPAALQQQTADLMRVVTGVTCEQKQKRTK